MRLSQHLVIWILLELDALSLPPPLPLLAEVSGPCLVDCANEDEPNIYPVE